MPPIRVNRIAKLMTNVLGENWDKRDKNETADESKIENSIALKEMMPRPSQFGSSIQTPSGCADDIERLEECKSDSMQFKHQQKHDSMFIRSADESDIDYSIALKGMMPRPSQFGSPIQIPSGRADDVEHDIERLEECKSDSMQLMLQQKPDSPFIRYDDNNSEVDPFSDTDSVVDPLYVPETSTSHYSDSDEASVNDRTRHLVHHCSQNQGTQNNETHHEIHPPNEVAQDSLNEQGQKKVLTRKRKRQPSLWKRNKQRMLRLEGKEHLSQNGNVVRGKSVQQVNCHCHHKCGDILSLSDRQKIFEDFLTLPDERSRWSFISTCVSKHEPKRRYVPSSQPGVDQNNIPSSQPGVDQNNNNDIPRKKNTFTYTLVSDGIKHQVCKAFFLATLDISGKKVQTAMKKLTSSGVVEEDKRGKNPAPNCISEEKKDMVRNHIKAIPVTDSHYCRSSTKRKYLPSGLSEMRLYQDYVEFCKEQEKEPVSSSYYIHIFTSENNYGFHRPKKDMCDYCTQFNNKSVNEQLEAKTDHELHITRKQEARDHKKDDKKHAKNDTTFHVYTMDMEKILLTPHLEVGQLYYKRKLKTYNFTVYNLADRQATNYMWHEANGTKGASEVSTCLWDLLTKLDPTVTEVTFFSDTAAGQNRNSILSAMFLRAVRDLPIQTINQKFMESGHSDMECDSVHSTIESRAKHTSIFVPEGWYTVARTAKVELPKYKVKEMHFKDFIDFKSYSQKQITNKNKADDGQVMRWLDLKWIQYRKNETTSIYYKTQLSQLEFKKLTIRRTSRKVTSAADIVLPLYKNQLPIDRKKLEDLQKLCTNGTIPSAYHDFYLKSLTSTSHGASDESEVED